MAGAKMLPSTVTAAISAAKHLKTVGRRLPAQVPVRRAGDNVLVPEGAQFPGQGERLRGPAGPAERLGYMQYFQFFRHSRGNVPAKL